MTKIKQPKLQLFELNWQSRDSSISFLFIHTNKTNVQFKKDVKSLLVKYGKDYLESENYYAGAGSWIEFIADKMSELGYQSIEPIKETFVGSKIITYPTSTWGKVVGQDLLQQAIEHNSKLNGYL